MRLAGAAQIAEEARAAFPRECCGLIEKAFAAGDLVYAVAIHATHNISPYADRLARFDPA